MPCLIQCRHHAHRVIAARITEVATAKIPVEPGLHGQVGSKDGAEDSGTAMADSRGRSQAPDREQGSVGVETVAAGEVLVDAAEGELLVPLLRSLPGLLPVEGEGREAATLGDARAAGDCQRQAVHPKESTAQHELILPQ